MFPATQLPPPAGAGWRVGAPVAQPAERRHTVPAAGSGSLAGALACGTLLPVRPRRPLCPSARPPHHHPSTCARKRGAPLRAGGSRSRRIPRGRAAFCEVKWRVLVAAAVDGPPWRRELRARDPGRARHRASGARAGAARGVPADKARRWRARGGQGRAQLADGGKVSRSLFERGGRPTLSRASTLSLGPLIDCLRLFNACNTNAGPQNHRGRTRMWQALVFTRPYIHTHPRAHWALRGALGWPTDRTPGSASR